MTEAGALAGMIGGTVTVVLFRNVIETGWYEIIPGVILATVAIVAVSRVTTPPERSWEHVDTMVADPV